MSENNPDYDNAPLMLYNSRASRVDVKKLEKQEAKLKVCNKIIMPTRGSV